MTQTPTTIDEYLAALRRAFGKAPPGLIADAMADAEEHLRGWVAAHPGQSEADAIRSYGGAEELVAEYLASDEKPSGPFQRPSSPLKGAFAATHRPHPGFFGVVKDPATYGALLYMLVSLGIGLLFFCWAVAGISLSLVFALLIFGVPFFLLFVGSVRGLSHAEGRIIELLLGVRMPRRLRAAGVRLSFRDRVLGALYDRRTWSSLFYMLLMLPLGIVYFTIAALGLAMPVFLIWVGLYQMIHLGDTMIVHGCDGPAINCGVAFHEAARGVVHLHNPPIWLEPWISTPVPGLLAILAAVLLLFLTLHLARLIGWLHGRIAEHLLVRL
jgi:hypothetical protein